MTHITEQNRLSILSVHHYGLLSLLLTSVISIDMYCGLSVSPTLDELMGCAFLYGLTLMTTFGVVFTLFVIMFKNVARPQECSVLLPRIALLSIAVVGVISYILGLIHLLSTVLSTTGFTVPGFDMIEARRLQTRSENQE